MNYLRSPLDGTTNIFILALWMSPANRKKSHNTPFCFPHPCATLKKYMITAANPQTTVVPSANGFLHIRQYHPANTIPRISTGSKAKSKYKWLNSSIKYKPQPTLNGSSSGHSSGVCTFFGYTIPEIGTDLGTIRIVNEVRQYVVD